MPSSFGQCTLNSSSSHGESVESITDNNGKSTGCLYAISVLGGVRTICLSVSDSQIIQEHSEARAAATSSAVPRSCLVASFSSTVCQNSALWSASFSILRGPSVQTLSLHQQCFHCRLCIRGWYWPWLWGCTKWICNACFGTESTNCLFILGIYAISRLVFG